MDNQQINQPPRNRPSNKKRRLIIVAISALGLTVVAIGTIFVLSLITGPRDGIVASTLRSDVDEKKEFEQGKTAAFGHFEVNINSVTEDYKPTDGRLPVTRGASFLLLNITAKNVDDAPHSISDFELAVLAGDTVIVSLFTGVEPVFLTNTVEPGESITGNILYEIPAGESDLKLYYNTQLYDYDAEKLKKIEHILDF